MIIYNDTRLSPLAERLVKWDWTEAEAWAENTM